MPVSVENALLDLRHKIRSIRFLIFDFDGVFTDNAVYVDQRGRESVRCWRGDGIGLRKLERIGIEAMVLSTEENPVVATRCEKMKIQCIQGCRDKGKRLISLVQERSLSMHQVAFMGNDINDLSCLQAVGLPIVVADAHTDVLSVAVW